MLSPLPNMGGLTGAGNCQWPGDFGNPICRITDGNTYSNSSMIVPGGGSGDENSFNRDSTLFVLQSNGLRPFVYSFDPAAMQATLKYSGPTLHLPRGGNFSYVQESIYYSTANAAGTSYGTLLQQSDFSSSTAPTPTTLFDFSSSANCLQAQGNAPTWADPPDVSKDDQTFSAGYSYSGDQGTGIYAVAWNRSKGCIMLNTQTGQVTSDPGWGVSGYVCGTPPCTAETFRLHNVKLRKDGKEVIVANQACFTTCTNGLSPYGWDLTNPLTLTPLAPTGTSGGGHWTDGYTEFVNNNGTPQGEWFRRTVPSAPLAIVSNFPTGITGTFDAHSGWGNVDLAETAPFFVTTTVGNADPTYAFGWQNEVLGIFPTTGIVKRFAHCNNLSSSTFNAWNCIGSTSQDGRFYMFTSPWNNTLGSTAGLTTCTPGTTGDCRGDAFVVATAAHPNLYVFATDTSQSISWWSDVQTYLSSSPLVTGATVQVQWSGFDNGSSGTISVTNGSAATTVTCSAGCSNQSSWTGMLIAGVWYEVASISGNSVTLASAYAGTTDSTAAFKAYNFTFIDGVANGWTSHGKRVNFTLSGENSGPMQDCGAVNANSYGLANVGNCATPAYVWTGIGSSNYTQCQMSGTNQQTPNWLNSTFQSYYKAAVQAFLGHYAQNPYVGYVRIALGHGGEAIPHPDWNGSATCQAAWQTWLGSTMPATEEANWVNNWLIPMLNWEGSLNSQKQLMVGVTPMPTTGVSSTYLADTVTPVAVANHVGFGTQGLEASDVNNCAGATADWCSLFQTYNYLVPLEVQTLFNSCPPGLTCTGLQQMTGPLPQLLQTAAANHADILELYWNDWLIALDPAYQVATGVSAATGASYLAALQATASGAYSQ
jgi:hypothetical protein